MLQKFLCIGKFFSQVMGVNLWHGFHTWQRSRIAALSRKARTKQLQAYLPEKYDDNIYEGKKIALISNRYPPRLCRTTHRV
jgi:hypothetical protein